MQLSIIEMSTSPMRISSSLKDSPTKGCLTFWRWGKLSPKYIKPFEVQERVGEVAYKFVLSLSLSVVHLVFHVSMLKRSIPDGLYKLLYEGLDVRRDVSYDEGEVQILDSSSRTLRRREVPLVKFCGPSKVLKRLPRIMRKTWEHVPQTLPFKLWCLKVVASSILFLPHFLSCM